jgi:hypothetical protein
LGSFPLKPYESQAQRVSQRLKGLYYCHNEGSVLTS